MAEGNGARGACALRRNCTPAEGNRAGDTGSIRRCCTVRICDRRRRSPWARNRGNCAALLDRLATGTRESCETNGGVPASAVGGRVGGAVPPSSCQFPVRKVPGSRAFEFLLRLWPAASRIPRTAGGTGEAGEGWTPPGSQTCMWYRCDRCDCLPGPCPGGTLAVDLNYCDYYSCVGETTCRRRGS